ncbi:MAG: NAD-dependent epimerase/dehydratase family protein [Maricaulaceae bacterium]
MGANTHQNLLIGITGGTGFVGRHVIQAALAHGHRVRVLARSPKKLSDIKHDNLDVLTGQLGVGNAALCEGCDAVLHIAGLIKARTRREFDAVNVDAAGEMASAAKTAGVKRFVLLSSMAARKPELSDYAGSKYGGEMAVKAAYDGRLAIIRAPAVFGPGDEATAPFIDLIKRGLLPTPGGAGWKTRKLSIVAVEDLAADIVMACADGRYDGRIVSPSSIPSLTWPDFADMASKAAGRKVRIVPLPRAVLYPVAGVTSATSRLFGMGHLTLGKLREFLYDDWSSEDVIAEALPMRERLAETIKCHG